MVNVVREFRNQEGDVGRDECEKRDEGVGDGGEDGVEV